MHLRVGELSFQGRWTCQLKAAAAAATPDRQVAHDNFTLGCSVAGGDQGLNQTVKNPAFIWSSSATFSFRINAWRGVSELG